MAHAASPGVLAALILGQLQVKLGPAQLAASRNLEDNAILLPP
jgi:hypothetical protein